jgi:iron complex outermembrane receptor protein
MGLSRSLRKARLLSQAGLTAIALAFSAGAALAQGAPDIVVTAQKRAENIQDVPISVTAVTAGALQEKAIQSVAQLSSVAPNVTFDAGTPFSGSSAALAAYIRGIGQNDFAFNLDPGVGVYVDGVYLARTVGANTDLLDVERIEVLKGPQGTLFGRNSIGGAISIVTRDPGKEFGGSVEATTGRFSRFDTRGSVDLPITDTLAGLITFSSKKRDGYQKRIPYPGFIGVTDGVRAFPAAGYENKGDTQGGVNEWTLRGKLKWEPTDRFDLTLAADYQDIDQEAQASSLLNTVTTGPTAAFGFFYNSCIAGAFDPNVCGARGTGIGTPGYAPPFFGVNVDADPNNDRSPYDNRFLTGDIDTTYATGNNFSKVKSWGAALTANYQLTDNMQLKSITAYRHLAWDTGMDLDASPLEFLHTSFDMQQQQISEELQLIGDTFGGNVDYVLGLYAFREGGSLHDYVTFPAGLLQIDGRNDLSTKAYAGFFHVNWKVTDKIGITIGGRYTQEDKKFQGYQTDLNGFAYKISGCLDPAAEANTFGAFAAVPAGVTCQQALGFPVAGNPYRYFPAGTNDLTFKQFTPRLGVEYHFTDDLMAYASYSKGFKTGGWTTRLSNPVPQVDGIVDFGPEKATSYEVGLKAELLDNKLVFNNAVFWTDYKGIQLNKQVGVSPVVDNMGDAEIYGFESEFQAYFTEAFSVTGSVGYTHAEYTFIDPAVNLPGQIFVSLNSKLPKTPEWKFNIGPRYEMSLANDSSVVLAGDFTYTSEMFQDTENHPEIERGSTTLVNLSATYKAPGDRWEAVLGGTNVTDERYIQNAQTQYAGGQVYATYSAPAEWYATLRVKF